MNDYVFVVKIPSILGTSPKEWCSRRIVFSCRVLGGCLLNNFKLLVIVRQGLMLGLLYLLTQLSQCLNGDRNSPFELGRLGHFVENHTPFSNFFLFSNSLFSLMLLNHPGHTHTHTHTPSYPSFCWGLQCAALKLAVRHTKKNLL